jgi:DNA-binding transcriptional ArsR family regulator
MFNHMVDVPAMDSVFHALAHGARREMIGRLADGDLTVGELAEPLAMSLAAASKHVKVLEGAGLVQRTIDGRRHVCRLDPAPLASAAAWLRFYERHWAERLDALEQLFREDAGPDDAVGEGDDADRDEPKPGDDREPDGEGDRARDPTACDDPDPDTED